MTARRPSLGPAARGIGALLLAAVGEALIRRGDTSGRGGLLYLAAIALFAHGSWPRREPAPTEGARAPRRRPWLPLAAGCAAGAVCCAALLARLERGVETPPTVALWILSFGAPLLGAAAASRATGFEPRWDVSWLPARGRGRAAVLALCAVVLALGVACRLSRLATVPFGINPDEGDRAAVAMQIARGIPVPPFFAWGWYHISMVYFHALAAVMRFTGLDVGGARVFNALSGSAALVIVPLLALRHFGRRAGLLTACLLAAAGPALQFSRIVTEAGPTALLWAVSALLFLEAARDGRAWAWAGAGIAGGLSIYFYPTGRMWPVIAAVFCAAVFAKGRGRRGRVAAGTAVAALCALVAAAPFFFHALREPGTFTVRARETTIFLKENPPRLSYFRPEWSMPRFLAVQVDRALGIFDKYEDANGIYPTGKPILPPALAALTLLGIGAALLRSRDERFLLLTLWFVVGFIGVVVTVETPNLHRMSTTVPLLPLFAALVLDDVARRVDDASPGRLAAIATAGACGLFAAAAMASELRAYFVTYAATDPWRGWRLEGVAVREQGSNAISLSLADAWHMVNSGWIRLLAPEAARGGIPFPARDLPLVEPPSRNLEFLVYPTQRHYLGFLRDVYPGGAFRSYPPVVDVYRVERSRVAAVQGALASAGSAPPRHVDALGDLPPGSGAGPFRWTAGLAVPEQANYAFRAEPGPARLLLDGTPVAAANGRDAEVSLAQGEHLVELRSGAAARLLWRRGAEAWRPVPAARLRAVDRRRGLFGTLSGGARWPAVERIDATLATSSILEELHDPGPVSARWVGTLSVPASGRWEMSLIVSGTATLFVDGTAVAANAKDEPAEAAGARTLEAGPHAVEVVYEILHPPGRIEWTWTPPGGEKSIVPPSVLTPPAGRGVGAPIGESALQGRPMAVPGDVIRRIP